MVCRNAKTHKAHPVNPLLADTPEERRLLAIGECEQPLVSEIEIYRTTRTALKARKQLEAQHSLSRVPPSFEEAQELHGLMWSIQARHLCQARASRLNNYTLQSRPGKQEYSVLSQVKKEIQSLQLSLLRT